MNKIKIFFSTHSHLQLVLITVILFVGIFVRLDDLGSQMTAVDDVGVVWTITQAKSGYTIDFVKNKIYDLNHPDYNTPQYNFLRSLYQKGVLEAILPVLNKTVKFVIIPQAWTYAPIQFFFTPLFVCLANDYHSLIFWGRFPSFIFSVLGLIAMMLLYFRLKTEKFLVPCLTSLLFLSFSWENIIYAKHMSSYAIGVLAVILLLHVLVTILKDEKLTIKKGIYIGLVLAILTNMQYQILYFVPALFLTWFLKYFPDHKINLCLIKEFFKTYNFKVIFLSFLVYIIFILPSFVIFIAPQTNANRPEASSISSNFYFNIPNNANIFDKMYYPINFFIENGFKVFKFVVTYLPYSSPAIGVSFFLIGLLLFLGILSFFYSKEFVIKKIGVFILFSLLTIAILVMMKTIAFGPTRHALIFLPFFAIIIAEGVNFLFICLQKKIKINIEYIIVALLIIFVMLPFFINYKGVLSDRREQIDENKIVELVQLYKPQYVLTSAFSLWSDEILHGWKKKDFSYLTHQNYVNLFEAASGYEPNVFLVVYQSDFNFSLCNEENTDITLKQNMCNQDNQSILYEFVPIKSSSLDISTETKAVYNSYLIKVFKIK